MSDFREKEEQPELVVPSAVNLNAEEEADEQASLVQHPQNPQDPLEPPNPSDPSNTSDSTSTPSNSAAKKASLGKSFSLVAILTVVSKLAGLIRDIVIAGVYGAGVLADAYNYAYLFTGNVLILFGGLGGPFHSATVATLNPRKDDPKSGVFITQVMVATGLVLLILAGLVCVIAPYLVQMLAGDYGSNPQIHALFTSQTIYQIRGDVSIDRNRRIDWCDIRNFECIQQTILALSVTVDCKPGNHHRSYQFSGSEQFCATGDRYSDWCIRTVVRPAAGNVPMQFAFQIQLETCGRFTRIHVDSLAGNHRDIHRSADCVRG